VKFINKVVVLLIFLILFSTSTKAANASATISSWALTSPLSLSIASQSVFVYNDKIFNISGANSGVPANSLYSSITFNGDLTAWANSALPPSAQLWHAFSQKDNKFYLLGGANDSIVNMSSVFLGVFDSSTNQITWQSLTPLPQTLALGASTIIGNKIYFAGGNPTPTYGIDSNTNQNIYSADINADGTIGSWSVAGTLPDRLIGFGMLEINNSLYIFGGSGLSGYSDNVRRATVNPDGTISNTWESLTSLPNAIWRFGITKSGNTLVVAGGQVSDGSVVPDVFYTNINPDGTLGAWLTGPELLSPNCCSPLVSVGNYLYLIGGHDGANYTDKVEMSQVLEPTPTPSPSSTPSPSPSPTPLVTPSPTPANVTKLFVIPGMGASWNLDAFINCKNTGYTGSWTLAPYAKGFYTDLLNTLASRSWNVLPVYYDWRQNISNNTTLLNGIINSGSIENEKVNIMGHSMGGLIGANYLLGQTAKTSKFLAVGSPFSGSALSYPAFVNNDIWTDNLIEKVGATLFFKHCGIAPSFQNILPTYDYLRDNNTKQLKNVSTLKNKNNFLPINLVSPFNGVKVGTLSGTGFSTLKVIDVVKDPKWPDGKPVGKENTSEGDGTVLTLNAQINGASSNTVIGQSHAGLVASTEGINKILEFFGSPGIIDPPYIEPKSALVIIGYPGNFWLTDINGNVTQSEDGMISILNPASTDYQLQIVPQSLNTQLMVGQFYQGKEPKYKEYKFRGMVIEPKIIHVSVSRPEDDPIHEIKEFQKPDFPNFWEIFWNFWKKLH
jgi:hypothetical protein